VKRDSTRSIALFGMLSILVSGCATWSTSSVDSGDRQVASVAQPTSPEKVLLTENDITDRKYLSLGDITVTVNKTTLFHSNPTKEQVNQKLREKAAELGADGVILVRYGSVGASPLSWGSLEGKGRAIRFQP